MSDTPPPDTGTPDTPPETPPPDDTPDTAAELEKWKAQARKHEERAKANAQAAKELDTLRQSSMSDQEKAVATARAEARTETMREVGAKLAAASIRTAAAGRVEVTAELLEGVNLSAFVDDDGEVDEAKVARWVDSIAPKPDENGRTVVPDLGQGARQNRNTPLGSDPLERDLKHALGIR